ncbi:MAG: yajC [Rhodospirillales bacterium]|nr:yajC [Rhodospirillales bacterium]
MSLFGLIPSAYAQTANAPAAPDTLSQIMQGPLPMVLMVGLIFYFLLLRPQQQKAKQLQKQLSDLRRGDTVVTSGGILGTVARIISDDELSIEIAEGVRVRVVRSTITGIAGKGEPRTDAKADSEDADEKSKPVRRGKTPPASAGKTPPAAANESKPEA